MSGKSKCRFLKEIRRQIAAENDIEFVTSECKYQGECTGTCPKCEAELRYLEQELEKRQKAGKAIAVAGVAAALVVGTSGCDFIRDKLDSMVQGLYVSDISSESNEFTEEHPLLQVNGYSIDEEQPTGDKS